MLGEYGKHRGKPASERTATTHHLEPSTEQTKANERVSNAVNNNIFFIGSAPRAADAARFARAWKKSTKCEGGRKKRPMVGATSDLIMPRATCAELIALSVLCCMLAMSRSDRQKYGCN